MSVFKEEKIVKALKEICAAKRDGATLSDIRDYLIKTGIFPPSVSPRWVRSVLEKLSSKKLIRKTESGKMVKYYPSPSQLTLDEFTGIYGATISLEKIRTEDEFREELEEQEERFGIPVSDDIAQRIHKERSMLDKLENVIPEMINANPRQVFLELIQILKREFDKLKKKRNTETSQEKRRDLTEKMRNILNNAHWISRQTLGIPVKWGGSDPPTSAAPIAITMTENKERFDVDWEHLKEYIEVRIPDTKTVIWTEPKIVSNYVFLGADTSTAEIVIRLPPYYHVRPIRIPANFGVRVSLQATDEVPAPEIYPEPRSVPELDSHTAEEKGYLLTLGTMRYLGDERYIGRAREAQMNTLQYSMVLEFLEKRTIPTSIFIDGRLFPYEHKLDDCFYHHRKFVLASLFAFERLVNSATKFRKEMRIIGVTKRPRVPLLLYFVAVWALLKKGGISEEKLATDLRTFLENIADGEMAMKLLKHVAKNESEKYPGKIPRTYILIRPFSALDDALQEAFAETATSREDEIDEEFWRYRIIIRSDQERERKPGLQGYAELKGRENPHAVAATYSFLVANARVAMFYYLPPNLNLESKEYEYERVVLPRMEVLLPDVSHLRDEEVARFVEESVLIPKDREFHTFYPESESKDHSLLVPSPVSYAHHIAKGYASCFGPAAEAYLKSSILRKVAEMLKMKPSPFGAYVDLLLEGVSSS